MLKLTEIDYPIYLYNRKEGKLKEIELSFDNEQQIINNLVTSQIFYWPDEYSEPIIDDINNIKSNVK